eukprot:9157615-Pyramimonas_sp.AAC.1
MVELRAGRQKLIDDNLGSPETFELTYGIPLEPLQPARSDMEPTVFSWGDGGGSWGPISYTDASGLHNSRPMLRRVGWSVVQLCPATGWPIRARHGG